MKKYIFLFSITLLIACSRPFERNDIVLVKGTNDTCRVMFNKTDGVQIHCKDGNMYLSPDSMLVKIDEEFEAEEWFKK